MIRQAEMRDLADLEMLFLMLIRHLHKSGNNYFNKDHNELRNALMAYLCYVINDNNTLIMVNESGDGVVKAFIIGGLMQQPGFFEDRLACRAYWLYPLSIQARKLVSAFEEWGRSQGATVMVNDVLLGNRRGKAAMEHYGMQPMWAKMVKAL